MSKSIKNIGKFKQKAEIKKSSISEPRKIPEWFVLLIFVITTIIYFWGQLSGTFYFWEDFVEFVYPTQTYAAVETAGGQLPFWNPFTFSGMPFLADIQIGYFYPFNRILSIFVTNDGTLPIWILQFIIIIHFFIAQFNIYFLCKKWGTSQIAAMIASVSFSFSMIMVFRVIHPMIIYHLAWFPLVVYFYHRAIATVKLKPSIWAGLILGFSFLSGHPQYTLFELLFLFFFGIWFYVGSLIKRNLKGLVLIKFTIYLFIPFIISAGIFMIQYLPSKELADLSQRAEMTYLDASEGSLEFKQIINFIAPNFFGQIRGTEENNNPYHLRVWDNKVGQKKVLPYYNYWETAFYAGLICLILGIIGFWYNLKDIKIAFLFFIALFGLLYALGSNGFLHKIFFYLPFFGSFRNPARLMFYTIFALSIASAFGFDTIIKFSKNNQHRKVLLLLTSTVLIICILGVLGLWSTILDTPTKSVEIVNSQFILPLLLGFIFLILIFLSTKVSLKANILGIVLLILVFVDLFLTGNSFINSKQNPKDLYFIVKPLQNMLQPQNVDDLFRVNFRSYQPPYTAFQRNQGLISRFMSIEGYNPLILKRVIPPINSRDTINQLYNVKYEIRFKDDNKPYFYEREDRLPRAWVVYNAFVTNEQNIENVMRYGGFDYSKTVVLEETPKKRYDIKDEVLFSKVSCLNYEPNYMKFEVEAEKDGILCFSEIWYPAWKVYVNSKEEKLLRANYCFRAVEVPSGKSIVEMKYESKQFTLGMYISLLVLIVSVVLLIIIKEKDRNGEI